MTAPQRRFIYIDPSLQGNVGHHANVCRLITREMAARGFEVRIFASERIEPGLQSELQAHPLFRWNAYAAPWCAQDRLAGWLRDFETISADTFTDLTRIGHDISCDDIVYFSQAMPAQLRAVIQWAEQFQTTSRPWIFVEFATEPGVQVSPDGQTVSILNPFADPRGVLYRHAAGYLSEELCERVFLGTYDQEISRLFTFLVRRTVQHFPLPQRRVNPLRRRQRGETITVGILGHQREDKGYNLVPQIAERLLAEIPDVRLLVQNGAAWQMPGPQAQLTSLAAIHFMLELDDQPADLVRWAELLEQSDLIVCPYSPSRFASAYSAVASEAVANGIPLVIPAGTTMSVLLREFDQPGVLFNEWNADAVYAAILSALDQFDSLAGKALEAAERWGRTRGSERLADHLMSYAVCKETAV